MCCSPCNAASVGGRGQGARARATRDAVGSGWRAWWGSALRALTAPLRECIRIRRGGEPKANPTDNSDACNPKRYTSLLNSARPPLQYQ